MSDKICNHTSVGMVIIKENKILLIERKKFPFGFAAPAGHVDEGETFEQAAERELTEEVGLITENIELVFEDDIQNKCRRVDGSWHHWKVYVTKFTGEVNASQEETKSFFWADLNTLENMIHMTHEYIAGKISEEDWIKNPGIEPVWVEILKKIDYKKFLK